MAAKIAPPDVVDAVTGNIAAHIAASKAAMAAARVAAAQSQSYVDEAQRAQDAADTLATWADENKAVPPPTGEPDWVTYVRAASAPAPVLPTIPADADAVPDSASITPAPLFSTNA